MASAGRLGDFEELILLALVRLRDDAYGVAIWREIQSRTQKNISIGAIYTVLDRLERKGFVSSHVGAPTPERGGRAKRYFQIKAPGTRALNSKHELVSRMLEGISYA